MCIHPRNTDTVSRLHHKKTKDTISNYSRPLLSPNPPVCVLLCAFRCELFVYTLWHPATSHRCILRRLKVTSATWWLSWYIVLLLLLTALDLLVDDSKICARDTFLLRKKRNWTIAPHHRNRFTYMEASFIRCKATNVAVDGRVLEWSVSGRLMMGDFDLDTSTRRTEKKAVQLICPR